MRRVLSLRCLGGLMMLWVLAARVPAQALTPMPTEDPFLWLEELASPAAMHWVQAENAKTLDALEQDPSFEPLFAQAMQIAEATDRLPMPHLQGGLVYNLWQDAEHVRGVWRRTTLPDYAKASPHWQSVLDLDALADREQGNWFWHGAQCRQPDAVRCLISLSDGGEDAVVIREFDTGSGGFVEGGFTLPTGKQSVAWLDADTLLVAREWQPGTLTASGYPYVVKRLTRGQSLDQAVEVYRGSPTDVSVQPETLEDGEGHRVTLLMRGVSFFEQQFALMTPTGPVALALPAKSSVEALVAGRLVVSLNESWTVAGRVLPAGAVVSLALEALRADPSHLRPTLVYLPGPREAVDQVVATRGTLVVTGTANVRGRLSVFTPMPHGRWRRLKLPVPDMSSVSVVSAESTSDRVIVSVTGFLMPTLLGLADTRSGRFVRLKQLPAKFDATRHVVEQFEAVSTDGTRIPYFVVRPKDLHFDGSAPTILNAYGGFQIAETPVYSANTGKLWLERGGVFVLANIRGGGEFGPAWHEAGLKTHRQRIYDDFAAVARDLIARRITSPRHLGIQGGSNGGLLMGVEFCQHPELWHAVDIAVPLLDMLRFEHIAAGPSWVGEYGSVSNPEERDFLASISPYNNIKDGVSYPTPFVWTTTKDDRVGPQHARKFAAKLGAMGLPYYFYEVTEGGHAAGANLREQAHTRALEMAYFTRQLMP